MIKKHLRTKEARTVFGKKELEIINKQLDGITLSQSERNRLSRDIKPKLEFIKNISSCQDEFGLKQGQNVKKIMKKVVDTMLQDKLGDDIVAILLFGSHVHGTVTNRSDIDICAVFNQIEKKQADQFRIRILGTVSNKVDVQVFNTLPQKIKRSIAAHHRILYKRSDYDNQELTVQHLKNNDYFIRLQRLEVAT